MRSLTPEMELDIRDLIDERVREAHVTKEDFSELKGIVKSLAVNVEGLGITVKELADAQKRTEARVEELADAQKRTEIEMVTLTKTVKNVQKELGGISHTIGYHLEDRAYKTLPLLLKRDLGVKVEGRLIRKFFIYDDGKEDEVNIFGRGFKDGHDVIILGEAKSQISARDIDDFLKVAGRVLNVTGEKNSIRIAVSYSIRPEVIRYAEEKKVKVYWSYELD